MILSIIFFSTLNTIMAQSKPLCASGVCLPENYNKLDMPVESIEIDVSLKLMDIYEINQDDFTMKISLFMELSWIDNRLILTEGDNTSYINLDVDFVKNIWVKIFFFSILLKRLLRFLTYSSMTLCLSRIEDLSDLKLASILLYWIMTLVSATKIIHINILNIFIFLVITYRIDSEIAFVCPIDYSKYPFHFHICKLKISSFSKTNNSMLFKVGKNKNYKLKFQLLLYID